LKELNILLILFAVLAVWRAVSGMKRGITEEMHRLMMLVLSLFVIAVGIHLYTSIQEKDTKNIVISAAVNIARTVFTSTIHSPVRLRTATC